jgi:signal transduction histidine kinase
MDSLGRLAAGIAHDLNNTLTPVLGLTALVLEDLPDGSQARANLEQVLLAGERGKELVQQILAFSRESAPDRKPVELCGLIRESLPLLRATLPATIDIREDLDEGGAYVLAAPTQFHQILMNLSSNARDAMGLKPGILTIALKQVDIDERATALHTELEPGLHVKLTVGDTGSGMDRGTLGRIFDPFFTTKPVGDGTGMGLSVVHGIVKAHEGAITVSSEPGHGTTIEIYLPLEQSHQAPCEPRQAAE